MAEGEEALAVEGAAADEEDATVGELQTVPGMETGGETNVGLRDVGWDAVR